MIDVAQWVTAIATVVYAVITAYIIWQNGTIIKQNYREEINQYRPIVTVCLANDETLLLLRVTNEGNRLAENVSITFDKTIEYDGKPDIDFLSKIDEMTSEKMNIGIGVSWDLSLCLGKDLDNIKPREIKAIVQYQSGSNYFNEEQPINFAAFRWSRATDKRKKER